MFYQPHHVLCIMYTTVDLLIAQILVYGVCMVGVGGKVKFTIFFFWVSTKNKFGATNLPVRVQLSLFFFHTASPHTFNWLNLTNVCLVVHFISTFKKRKSPLLYSNMKYRVKGRSPRPS